MISSRGSPTNERSIFRAGPHVLLMGSDARVTAAIAGLRPHLPSPVVHWHPVAVMEPPPASGTLVIWELDALDGLQQELLLLWMERHADVVVISVARSPVFPLVLAGKFLDALYYRLNMLCLAVPDTAH